MTQMTLISWVRVIGWQQHGVFTLEFYSRLQWQRSCGSDKSCSLTERTLEHGRSTWWSKCADLFSDKMARLRVLQLHPWNYKKVEKILNQCVWVEWISTLCSPRSSFHPLPHSELPQAVPLIITPGSSQISSCFTAHFRKGKQLTHAVLAPLHSHALLVMSRGEKE